MAGQDVWTPFEDETSKTGSPPDVDQRSGFCHRTGIYHSLLHLGPRHRVPTDPDLHIAKFVLSQFPHSDVSDTKLAVIDSASDRRLTYGDLRRSIRSLAASLYHGLGVRTGDVVLLLATNSYLYPVISLAVLSIGAVLTTSNPINTAPEITKQIRDSGAKLAVSSPDQIEKLSPTGIPVILTHRHRISDERWITVEELINGGEAVDAPTPEIRRSDPAALLYSSGTTGVSKGVVLTHGNLIAVVGLLKWTVETWGGPNEVFLAFIPMFHIYGLAFFAVGIFAVGSTVVTMERFDLHGMLDAVGRYGVTYIPAVPPVILALAKKRETGEYDLSSLRRVGSGAAPLSKKIADSFRKKFPWIELKSGYGLTESGGAATFFVSAKEAMERSASVGSLFPGFTGKVVDVGTGRALPPGKEGELWLRGETVMKGYFGNEAATSEAIDSEGWLRTGDLSYFDEDGFVYIVDRIKELIKHNGYQVAPAELEALLFKHPQIIDVAVVPEEEEKVGQIPVAFVVRAVDSKLNAKEVVEFVASQVAPYKKVRKVRFINAIPRSAAGKILRKELVALNLQLTTSRL